jgi:hypothetical protein
MERAHSIDCVLRFAPSELGTYLVGEGVKMGRVGAVADAMYNWWGDVFVHCIQQGRQGISIPKEAGLAGDEVEIVVGGHDVASWRICRGSVGDG